MLLNDRQSGRSGITSIGAQVLVSPGGWTGVLQPSWHPAPPPNAKHHACWLRPQRVTMARHDRPSANGVCSHFPSDLSGQDLRFAAPLALSSSPHRYFSIARRYPRFVVLCKAMLAQGLKTPSSFPFQKAGADCAGTTLAPYWKCLPLAACA